MLPTIFENTAFLDFKWFDSSTKVSAPYSLKNLYLSYSNASLIAATMEFRVSAENPSFFTKKHVERTFICLNKVL
jgi:hypothetical protein